MGAGTAVAASLAPPVTAEAQTAASAASAPPDVEPLTGTDPKTSVVNRYLQSWDAHNLFVMGASVFPQNASYNPIGVVGALAYWSANAITTQYLTNPGPLVQA
jgi:hypothetical protein